MKVMEYQIRKGPKLMKHDDQERIYPAKKRGIKNPLLVIILSLTSILISILIYMVAKKVPAFAQWYVVTIYPVLVATIGRISNLISKSMVECIVYISGITIVYHIGREIYRLIKQKVIWRKVGMSLIATSTALLALITTLYVFCCGINYYATDFVTIGKLEVAEYTSQELEETCEKIVSRLTELSTQVPRKEDGTLKVGKNDYTDAKYVMQQLGKQYDRFQGYYPNPKPLMVSEILSYQQLSGVYSPFTIEANFNEDMTPYYIPFTMCHELAHLKGFMKEEEANYIAYLACTSSDLKVFEYSGYMLGYSYCIGELRHLDNEAYQRIISTLPEVVRQEFAKNNEFWDYYDGMIANVSDKVNDTYLKVNAQADGIRSYNKVVGLIVAADKKTK